MKSIKVNFNRKVENGDKLAALGMWISCLFFMLMAFPNYGQATQKKVITEAEYGLYGSMQVDKISDDGKWVSCTTWYHDSPAKIHVIKADGKMTFELTSAASGAFLADGHFAFLDTSETLTLLELATGKKTLITSVSNFTVSGDSKFLIATRTIAGGKILEIRSATQLLSTTPDLVNYKVNSAGDAIIVATGKEGTTAVQLLHLNFTVTPLPILVADLGEIIKMEWNSDGGAVSFLTKNAGQKDSDIYFYLIPEKKLYHLEPSTIPSFPKGFHIEGSYANGLTISPDRQRVIFRITKDEEIAEKFDGVQIWNGNDAVAYPERRAIAHGDKNMRTVVWWPADNKFQQVSTEARPQVMMNPTFDFALNFNSTDLGPQYKQNPDVNYLVTNLKTGKQEMLLENQTQALGEFGFSPNGKYYAYLKEGEWWVYDFFAKKQFNLVAGRSVQITFREPGFYGESYGMAGWNPDDNYIIVYDQYDLWKLSTDGSAPIRITNGRENGITYRLAPLEFTSSSSMFTHHANRLVNLNSDTVLQAKKGTGTGYYILKPNGKLQLLVLDASANTGIIKATQADVYAFQSTSYEDPSSLKIVSTATKPKKLYQSNTHHYNYAWGKQEVVSYKNVKNKDLQGILYYPANFDPAKKYPMIVHIYEKQMYQLHDFVSPSLYDLRGFNLRNMTAEGYFVFYPDIEHEVGDPGVSGAQGVISATEEVLKRPFLDAAKVALIGASFGGYQTNFIITQTDMFACTVSGMSVSDMESYYLSIGWNMGRPEMWRFENQQWRMNKSLFEDREGYDRNSPLKHVEKVNTPLLLWVGEHDPQIHYFQSIAYYLALHRLKKEAIMLIYPGESHSILQKHNQVDMSRRIKEWFKYYLKNDRSDGWIKNGTSY